MVVLVVGLLLPKVHDSSVRFTGIECVNLATLQPSPLLNATAAGSLVAVKVSAAAASLFLFRVYISPYSPQFRVHFFSCFRTVIGRVGDASSSPLVIPHLCPSFCPEEVDSSNSSSSSSQRVLFLSCVWVTPPMLLSLCQFSGNGLAGLIIQRKHFGSVWK